MVVEEDQHRQRGDVASPVLCCRPCRGGRRRILLSPPSRNGISGRVGLAGCQVGFGQVSSSLYIFPIVVSFSFSSVFYFTNLNSNLFAGLNLGYL
jgi:hypothetical protein